MSGLTSEPVSSGFVFRPTQRAMGVRAYSAGDVPAWVDLRLDANEGPKADAEIIDVLRSLETETIRRYPDARTLEALLAERLGVSASRVMVTAGGDDAIDRVCRATLEPGREIVLHTPTFEMIRGSAELAGAVVSACPWTHGPFPAEELIGLIGPKSGLVAIVSPNNPTGGVIGINDAVKICEAAASVGALVLVDLAYVEFAERDPTPELLGLGNAVMVRTFSKAFGLAGLRVGYAVVPEAIAPTLRAMGGPYPTSGLSLALAARSLGDTERLGRVRSRVRSERARLIALCAELDLEPLPSEGNFALVCTPNAALLKDRLIAMGISVRAFAGKAGLEDALRITLPIDEAAFDRLTRAIRSALRPEAILFDMDGVLADVAGSYREAIVHTATAFGVSVSAEDVRRAKSEGNANNDWVLTQRLLRSRGISVDIEEVTEAFQRVYLGVGGVAGLRERETLIPDRGLLIRLAERVRFGVVTGRPRAEAEWFLDRAGIADLFQVLVCMEDGPAKPSPEPVRRAMDLLGVQSAWLVGDTVDDVRAARSAGVLPIGIAPPGETGAAAILRADGAIVISQLGDIEGMLP